MDNEKKYAAWLRRQGRSKSTISSYSNSLRLYFESGYKWTFEDACLWKESEMQRVKPSTVNIRIHAINTYAQFTRVRWRLKPVKVQNQQYVEHQLTMSQYEKLLSCLLADGELRWWAAIKVLACTGVRISEFLQIKREDLKTGYVDVCGKGAKYRRIWFSSSLRQEVLSTYKEEGLLLPYSDGVIRKRLHAFAQKYKLPKEPLHPHEFRAFYARQVYDRCKDLKFLQDLLGHSDIKTTVRYLRKTSKGISRRISKIVTWWDITGELNPHDKYCGTLYHPGISFKGAFHAGKIIPLYAGVKKTGSNSWTGVAFDSDFVSPSSNENNPVGINISVLFRLSWDITGIYRFGGVVGSAIDVSTATGIISFFDELSHVIMFEKNHRGYVGRYIKYDTKYKTPPNKENIPAEINLSMLFRISWDITGRFSCSIDPNFEAYAEGSFRGVRLTEIGTGRYGTDGEVVYGHTMLGSRCVPRQTENIPLEVSILQLIRIAWDIRGEYRFSIGHYADDYKKSGVFGSPSPIERSPNSPNNVRANYEYMTIKFSNSFVAPCSGEKKPLTQSFFVLQRIAWDIRGAKQRVYFDSGKDGTLESIGTGVFESTTGDLYMNTGYGQFWMTTRVLTFDASRDTPTKTENTPTVLNIICLIRITWDITGKTGSINFDGHFPLSGPFYKEESSNYKEAVMSNTYYDRLNLFDISRSVPTSDENKPCSIVLMLLCRISWDITGEFGGSLPGGEHGVGIFVAARRCFIGLGNMSDSLRIGYFEPDEQKAFSMVRYSNSYVSPKQNENTPIENNISVICRIAWDITGRFGGAIQGGEHGVEIFENARGCFIGLYNNYDKLGSAHADTQGLKAYVTIKYSNSYVSPKQNENTPIENNISVVCRIAWDITGEFRFGDVVGSALNVSRTKGILGLYESREHTLMYEYNDYYEGRYINIDSKYQIPPAKENIPSSVQVSMLIRLLWSEVIMLVR